MAISFNEFAKVGRKFKVAGIPGVYKIIQVDSDKIVVNMVGSTANFEIGMNDAEDSFNEGVWKAIEIPQPTTNQDGMDCCKCKKFFEYAAPNQDDGTMMCWSCRNGF